MQLAISLFMIKPYTHMHVLLRQLSHIKCYKIHSNIVCTICNLKLANKIRQCVPANEEKEYDELKRNVILTLKNLCIFRWCVFQRNETHAFSRCSFIYYYYYTLHIPIYIFLFQVVKGKLRMQKCQQIFKSRPPRNGDVRPATHEQIYTMFGVWMSIFWSRTFHNKKTFICIWMSLLLREKRHER